MSSKREYFMHKVDEAIANESGVEQQTRVKELENTLQMVFLNLQATEKMIYKGAVLRAIHASIADIQKTIYKVK